MAMITTIYGDMDEASLEKREGLIDNANETTSWVEYRKPGIDEIIHRSVHVILKEIPVFSKVETGKV